MDFLQKNWNGSEAIWKEVLKKWTVMVVDQGSMEEDQGGSFSWVQCLTPIIHHLFQ